MNKNAVKLLQKKGLFPPKWTNKSVTEAKALGGQR